MLLIVVGMYCYNFGSSELSDNNDDWSTFGDYFGGIINPVVGIVNLALLYYITVLVSKSDDERLSANFLKESYDLFNEKVADLDFDNPPIEFHNKLASFGGFIIQFYRENEYLIRNINYFDRLIEQFEKQLADLSEKVEKKEIIPDQEQTAYRRHQIAKFTRNEIETGISKANRKIRENNELLETMRTKVREMYLLQTKLELIITQMRRLLQSSILRKPEIFDKKYDLDTETQRMEDDKLSAARKQRIVIIP